MVSLIDKLHSMMPKKDELDKWQRVLIRGKMGHELTKSDIHSYYENPKIKKAILREVGTNPVWVRQQVDGSSKGILKRYVSGTVEPIKFLQSGNDVNDPTDFSYYTNRRMTELHEVHGPIVTKYVVDMDPGSRVDEKSKKSYTQAISDLMATLPEVKNVRVRFSAGKKGGFYVEGFLKKPMDIDTARFNLEQMLVPIADQNKAFTMGMPKENQIRLDISTYHVNGSVKAPYSLDSMTGLVSIPVDDLPNFDERQALPHNVLGGKITPQTRLKE